MKKSWIILLFFLISCTQRSGQTNNQNNYVSHPTQFPSLKEGMIHKYISCIADTTFSYALYLPETHANITKPKNIFPVIFFFDAHKRGVMPVEKYAALAEKYGLIIVGSNNSENGQPPEETDRIISLLFNDVAERFNIDHNQMYASGFSGGARVAARIALFRKENVAGVIGCAAGFPPLGSGFNTQFSYLAIVGDKDFNYHEMRELDIALDQTPIQHYLLIYDGKHDWPPEKIMQEGFEFLQFDAMRKNQHLKDEKEISAFLIRNDSIRAEAQKEGKTVLLVQTDRKIIAFLDQLVPTDMYKAEFDSLVTTSAYMVWRESEEKAEIFERNQQQKFAAAMGSKNLSWWLQEIEDLYKKPEDPVSLRLQNYLSLVSYMYASGTLKNNQFKEAEKYLTIYKKVDPDNPEVYYLKAVLLTRTGKAELALAQLQVAADKGFNEYERMQNSKDFNGFQDNEVFERILLQIRDKSEQ